MESSQAKRSLHPVLWVAAISVTVFSLVGVGAMTGLIPTAGSSETPAATDRTAHPASDKPARPTLTVKREAAQAPVKRVAHTPKPRSSQPIQYAYRDDRRVVSDSPRYDDSWESPRVVERDRSCVGCGTVEAVREVRDRGEPTWMGSVAGGVAGGLLGNQIGKGRGRDLATVAGAVGGVFAGREIEKRVRGTSRHEVAVRLDDGSMRVLSYATPPGYQVGDRVRVSGDTIRARY